MILQNRSKNSKKNSQNLEHDTPKEKVVETKEKEVIETTGEEVSPDTQRNLHVPSEEDSTGPPTERSSESEKPSPALNREETRALSESTVSGYVKSGKLFVFGLHESDIGAVPFAYSCDISNVSDGPVDFGNEEMTTAIQKVQKPMAGVILHEKLKSAAEQLVERSRAGDQNAMAMIMAIADQARKGNPRARKSAKLIRAYIEEHPVQEGCDHHNPDTVLGPVARQLGSRVGDDGAISAWTAGIPNIYCAALVLASGPTLVKERVKNIGSHFGPEAPLYWQGFANWGLERMDGNEAHYTGRAVALARTIQGIRAGALPVSKLSPMAGWELGE